MYNFPKDFYSDVRIEHIYSSHIRIEMGRLEEIKESNDSGAFIRLFDGKKWYYSSTTDLDSINQELANLASLRDTFLIIYKILAITLFLEDWIHPYYINFLLSNIA